MIRFIRIGDQINEGEDEFAFFDTCTDRFLSFSGEQVFESRKDFSLYAEGFSFYRRCVSLIPEEIKK